VTPDPHNTSDFTEQHYRELLRVAAKTYSFTTFTDAFSAPGRPLIWRHDVDLSVHRAARLAAIEWEEGVHATYLFSPHSPFYNVLEREVAGRIRAIADLGHSVGLHFDPQFYGLAENDELQLEHRLAAERRLVEDALGIELVAFSFHDPSPSLIRTQRRDAIAGMANAYGPTMAERFAYCSDSNGYWRFRRLHDVLEAAVDERLHVLTHPEWWTPEAMSPRDRVARCIDGRAARLHQTYDERLEEMGRLNVR